MFNSNSSENTLLEPVVKEDYNSQLRETIYRFSKIMNKRTDQEFNTPEFLLDNTIQSCYVFINWHETEVTFSLISKYEKDAYCIKPSFTGIKISYETNEISSDFKTHAANNYHAYCNVDNNLDFYNYRILEFEFNIRHMTNICDNILPKKCELYSRLKNLYKEKKFTDLKIYVKGIEFLAHKAIVGRHPTFAAMFENSTEENNVNVKIIDIKELDPAIFEFLLNYLYVGETEKIDFNQHKLSFLFDLIQAADKYQIDDLKNKLIEKTIRHMNKDNIIDILLFAEKYNITHLKTRSIYYITVYRKYVSENVLFKQLVLQNAKLTGELLYYALQSRL